MNRCCTGGSSWPHLSFHFLFLLAAAVCLLCMKMLKPWQNIKAVRMQLGSSPTAFRRSHVLVSPHIWHSGNSSPWKDLRCFLRMSIVDFLPLSRSLSVPSANATRTCFLVVYSAEATTTGASRPPQLLLLLLLENNVKLKQTQTQNRENPPPYKTQMWRIRVNRDTFSATAETDTTPACHSCSK